jgi:endonuclease YncB( thermonuclease family)
MKKLLLAFVLLFAVIGTAQVTFTGKVVGVKDGDTVVVLDSLKVQHTIRLAGVDAPEKRQDFGYAAKEFVSKYIFENKVIVKIIAKDRYGRSVGWITYDNELNLSKELLKAGLAWHYKEYDKSKLLQELEDKARAEKVGLWSLPNPVYPSEYRKAKTRR